MANLPKKIQLRLVGLAGALILAIVLLFPVAAMAQGSCNTAQVLEVAAEANRAGYYGVVLDLATCRVEIIFKNPGGAPATATSPVSPLPAASAPFTVTVTMTTTSTAPSAPLVNRMKALDYIQDDGEIVPFLGGQTEWVAPRIQLAIDASDMGLDTVALFYDAVTNLQFLADDLGTTVLGGSGTLPQYRDFRYLIHDNSFNQDTVLPEYVEEVFCLKFEGQVDQACLFLGSAAFGNRLYSGVDGVYVVR